VRSQADIARDVVEQPERDDLRLEFADAVENRDPQWARFIRASLDRNSSTWEIDEFLHPKVDLETRLQAPFRRLGDVSVSFHRGFPTTAYLPLKTFLEHGDEIMSLAPILEVRLGLPELDERGFLPHWKAYLPDLVKCTALARVRQLLLGGGSFDFTCVKNLLASPHAENLLSVRFPRWAFDSDSIRDQQEDEMWSVLLEKHSFRRMLDWGMMGKTRRYYGDRMTKEPYPHYDETTRYTVTYQPMDEESRALEQKYGYIPCLHARNWDATVLDALRGIKPDYPVGATPTEEMYAVPPEKDTSW
jgi:hypothetical protein